MKTNGVVKSSLGKNENFLTDAVKFVKKEVRAVENKLERGATTIATLSTIFGISIGIVVGIVGTVLVQTYVMPPASQVPPVPPRA